MADLTKHHLIPRTRIAWVCRPCHSHIHDVFSEKELAQEYHSLELLLADPGIQRFIAWIKKKPVGFKPSSRTMKRT